MAGADTLRQETTPVPDSQLVPVPVGNYGGRARSLLFDLNAFILLEKKFGSINEAMQALASSNIEALRYILWCGLVHDETVWDEITGEPISYNIKVGQVGSWFGVAGIRDLTDKLSDAIIGASPEVSEQEIMEAAERAKNELPAMQVILEQEPTEAAQ